MHPPLSPTGHLSPMGLRLNPGSNPDVGLLGLGAQADLLGSPAAALGATGAFGGPLVGFDSVHSSTSTNVVSGTGYGLLGGAGGGGLLSPENSYLAEAAQYAHDGLDVPGTAQVRDEAYKIWFALLSLWGKMGWGAAEPMARE
jgi:hypothetical protein